MVIAGTIAAIAAGAVLGMSPAQATTGTTYYFQGTGDTVVAPEHIVKKAAADDTKLIDASTDLGWFADFSPVQGTATADQSILNAEYLAGPSVKQDLADGKRVVLEGFSLGALAAGDLGSYLAAQGVDISKVQVTAISDGRMDNTGALIVLQPLKPVLDLIGISVGPRTVPSAGHWTIICIQGDGVCDTPDPVRDPVGALDALVGYVTKHGALDKFYNYDNLDELDSTTYVNDNVETVVYHAPRAITRLVQTTTGSSELSERLDLVLDKLITSEGDPGQVKQYKTIPETIRDVASLSAPQAPLLPTTVDELSTFAGEVAYEVTVDMSTVVGGTAGGVVGGLVGSNFGPAGTALGTQIGTEVGEFVGEQAGQALAPVVQAGVEAATESLVTGNQQPLVDFANSVVPGIIPIPAH